MILPEQIPPSLRCQLWASIVSIACFLRGLPLFFRATPKTPLRVLCLIAFDTLHFLRTSTPLPRHRVRVLATLLDFGACSNADLDRKAFCPQEYQALRQRIEKLGVTSWVDEYLPRLQDLERRRPSPGGDHRRFDEVRSYRESVARLSLGTVVAIALGEECVEDGIRAIRNDHDLATLFRVVMLCQIIDDVLDYGGDLSAELPSFLTATPSLPQAIALTTDASRTYAAAPGRSTGRSVFPLEASLYVLTAVTKLAVAMARRSEPRHASTAGQGP